MYKKNWFSIYKGKICNFYKLFWTGFVGESFNFYNSQINPKLSCETTQIVFENYNDNKGIKKHILIANYIHKQFL